MVFTTLLCKFYSQLQLNGVCFVHSPTEAIVAKRTRRTHTHTGTTQQPHCALQRGSRGAQKINFPLLENCCAPWYNECDSNKWQKRENDQTPNGNGKNDNNTVDDSISLAAIETLNPNDSLASHIFFFLFVLLSFLGKCADCE